MQTTKNQDFCMKKHGGKIYFHLHGEVKLQVPFRNFASLSAGHFSCFADIKT